MTGTAFTRLMTSIGGLSLVSTAVGAVVGAYGQYKEGQENQAQAEANAELARRQAVAQQEQAAEYERQAEVERNKAGIEQIQGEVEAAKRARARAAEIGSTYATAAGNGILITGSETDTFANILKSQEQEAQADIQAIRANTAMNVWSREEEAKSLLFSAEQSRAGAQNSIFSANEYSRQGRSAYKAGIISSVGTLFSGAGKVGSSAYEMFS